ncbi:hypothetical protein D1872_306540 [compost metagenome]
MPVLARVAAILLPMCPDLPMPTTTTRPLLARISSHALTKSASMWASKPSTASSSKRMVRCADWIRSLDWLMSKIGLPDEKAAIIAVMRKTLTL